MEYTENIEENMDLVQILAESYPQNMRKGDTKLHRVSPSRIVNCLRGSFFESLGYKEPLRPVSDQNFGYGSLRHDTIQDKFLDLGILLRFKQDDPTRNEAEYKIQLDDPPLLGYVDGIFTEWDALLEIKTKGKKLSSIGTPDPGHIDQAQIYMHITGIPKAYILYESKIETGSSLPWKQFIIEYDKPRAEKLLNRGRYLMKMLEKRRVPLQEPNCFCNNPACFNDKIYKKENLKGSLI